MKQLRNAVIRTGLEALYFSGAHHLLRPMFAGIGTIFMLHHVRPRRDNPFQPNRHLEVTPEFLRTTLAHVRSRGIDIVTADEMHRRLSERDFSRRFACFSFDDGYRDNRDFALPVMREYDAPLTVYVASDFADGAGRIWWVTLERIIAVADRIDSTIGNTSVHLDTRTVEDKQAAFTQIHDLLRGLPDDRDIAPAISELCARHGVEEAAISREMCLSWDELKPFAPSATATSRSKASSRRFMRSQPAGRGSKRSCSAPWSTSPIPTATATLRGRASSLLRKRRVSRPPSPRGRA